MKSETLERRRKLVDAAVYLYSIGTHPQTIFVRLSDYDSITEQLAAEVVLQAAQEVEELANMPKGEVKARAIAWCYACLQSPAYTLQAKTKVQQMLLELQGLAGSTKQPTGQISIGSLNVHNIGTNYAAPTIEERRDLNEFLDGCISKVVIEDGDGNEAGTGTGSISGDHVREDAAALPAPEGRPAEPSRAELPLPLREWVEVQEVLHESPEHEACNSDDDQDAR